ncbi:Der1-like family-domain-containing protein [Pelagophyceae sp. CCMP2097]|nr:Der1-like family-domain-containing protein [Pelagophyceae sp. CCMP2097]
MPVPAGASPYTVRGPHGLGAALAQRRRARHPLFALRGGGGADDDDDDDDAVDDDVFDEDAEDNAVSDADFEEETLKGKVLKAWHGTPPMTQVYVGASLALTIGSAVLHNNKYPSWLLLEWGPTLKQFQLWRPFTTFLFYGPFGLSYLLTIHFVWTYMSILEKLSHAEPWEFLMMMGFGAGSLLLGTSLGMSSRLLGHNLSCFLMYIWSRTYEGQEVNVLEFFAIKAELLPWFFVAQTYLFEQEFPIHDLLGIAIGHLYTVARQRKLFSAPRKLVDAFEARPELMARYEAMADEFG